MSRSRYHRRPCPGFGCPPRWFRNEWTTRAMRREARRLTHRDHLGKEVILTEHNRFRLYYW